MRNELIALTAAGLLAATPLAGCQEDDRAERLQETYEEAAEGAAETEAAAAGANELEQEMAGSAAEEQIDETFEAHEERMEDLEGEGASAK